MLFEISFSGNYIACINFTVKAKLGSGLWDKYEILLKRIHCTLKNENFANTTFNSYTWHPTFSWHILTCLSECLHDPTPSFLTLYWLASVSAGLCVGKLVRLFVCAYLCAVVYAHLSMCEVQTLMWGVFSCLSTPYSLRWDLFIRKRANQYGWSS